MNQDIFGKVAVKISEMKVALVGNGMEKAFEKYLEVYKEAIKQGITDEEKILDKMKSQGIKKKHKDEEIIIKPVNYSS